MAGFQDQLEELFAPVGGVTLRKMFGGLGAFREGIVFAVVVADVLYLKVDDTTIPRFQAERSRPWTYEGRGRTTTMPYWTVPERLFDEPDEFRDWALMAFDVAERSKKPKAKVTKKVAKPAKKAAAKKPKSKPKPKPKKKTAPKRR